MKLALYIPILGYAIAAPALAGTPLTVEGALTQYCEPLFAGSTAAQITQAAKSNGFKNDSVGGQPVLMQGELIVAVSDSPRVCLVQAPTSMTFAQGVFLIDGWAARHPGSVRGAATTGPDGAPVSVWVVPKQKKYLLVSQQTNPRAQKVLNFILGPTP